MSLLSICKDICYEVTLSPPATIVGNADPAAQNLLRYVTKAGKALMRTHAWQILRTERTFTALGQETQTGILPTNFDRFVPQTFWNYGSDRLITGPISAVEWQGLKAISNSNTYINPKFIQRGGEVSIFPVPGGGEDLVFEYVNKYWVTDLNGVEKAAFTVDTDLTKFDDELIIARGVFEFLNGEGQPFDVAWSAYNSMLNEFVENDEPDAPVLAVGDVFGPGRRFTGVPPVRNIGRLF